ncbi:MAG TPA: ABC transporter substrate-binding protein [Actinomycetota bacterium]|nr:ABC transporter substrate-binding protein [Actinomycetota bacterium]
MKRLGAAMLAIVALASSCSSDQGPIVVGAVYPTAGGQGMGGIEEFRGVRLAADLVNADGGVRGRPIRLVLEPADSFDGAPGAVQRAVDAGASVVVGSYGSTISAPAAEAASRLDVVFWETGAVGEVGKGAAPGTRFFRAVGGGGSLGEAAVAFIRDQRFPGAPGREARYSVVYVDDPYGRAVALGAEEEINDSGLPLAGTFPYELESVDYVRLAKRILRAGTDVLVVVAYLVDGVNLRRALVAEKVPLLGTIGTSSSYCHPEFGRILGEDALGLFASDKPDAGSLDPAKLSPEAESALRRARDEYRRRHNEEMSAAALSGFGSAWGLFRHVLPRARSLSADGVAAAAQSVRLPVGTLPSGSGLRFAPSGDPRAGENMNAIGVIWEWVSVNTRAIVWPPSFATSPIVPIAI